jgi:exosortase
MRLANRIDLSRLTVGDWGRIAAGLVVLCLVVVAYGVLPVAYEQPLMTTYVWLTAHWENISHYSHGPLIPLIALGLVWWKHAEFKNVKWGSSNWGYAVILFAMMVYYTGVKAGQPRLVVISFVFLLYGLALALGGRDVFRLLFFPISFLFLMVPLNFFEERIGFPLRLIVAHTATTLLNLLGIEAVRIGSGIRSAVFNFDVADPCSGIRSLMALTTVTAAYAYVTQNRQWKRWVLFLAAAPLAVLGNTIRVLSIAMVAQVYGQDVASKAYHDYSGYIVFGVALSAMVLVGVALNFPYRKVVEHWLHPLPAPAPPKSAPPQPMISITTKEAHE